MFYSQQFQSSKVTFFLSKSVSITPPPLPFPTLATIRLSDSSAFAATTMPGLISEREVKSDSLRLRWWTKVRVAARGRSFVPTESFLCISGRGTSEQMQGSISFGISSRHLTLLLCHLRQ